MHWMPKLGIGTFIQHFGLGRPLQPWTLSSSVCIRMWVYLSACLIIRCSMVPSSCRGRVLISGMVCLLLQCSILSDL